MYACPKCGKQHNDAGTGWPITTVNGVVELHGCQDCWEQEVGNFWWEKLPALMALDNARKEQT